MGKGVRVGARLDVIEHSPENSPLVPLVCKDLARSSDDQRAHRPAQDVAIFPLSPPQPREGLTPSAGMAPACRPLWGRSGSRGLPPPTSPAQRAAVVSHTQPGAVGGTQVPCVCLSTRGGKWSKFPSPQGGGAGLSRDHPAALRPGDPSMSPALTYGDLKGDWLVSVFPVNHRGLQEGSK